MANWSYTTKVVEPNAVLADLALLKILRCIQKYDKDSAIISAAKQKKEIQSLLFLLDYAGQGKHRWHPGFDDRIVPVPSVQPVLLVAVVFIRPVP